MTAERVELGRSGIAVTPLVFGAMAPPGGFDPALRRATLEAALATGLTSIDTAPLYEFGRSEQIIGEVIRGQRERVQLLTKVGLRWDDRHGELLFRGVGYDGATREVRRDSRPRAVRRDVEDSLRRLGCEVIDVVQVHHLDSQTSVAETMGELLRLRDEGKLRAIGVSNYSPLAVEQACVALGDVPLCCHQLPYSLLDRRADAELLPQARERAIGVLAYSPLAAGRLSRVSADEDSIQGLAEALRLLRSMAEGYRATPAQLALAWALAQPGIDALIIGARRPSQVEESAGALALAPSPGDLSTLGAAFARVRMPDPYRARGLRGVARRARELWTRLWPRVS